MTNFAISRRTLMGLTAGLVTLAGIGPAFAETTLERARREGFIRAGFANEAPYGFATPDGKPSTGYEAPINSGDLSRDHPAWPHRHHHFYDGI